MKNETRLSPLEIFLSPLIVIRNMIETTGEVPKEKDLNPNSNMSDEKELAKSLGEISEKIGDYRQSIKNNIKRQVKVKLNPNVLQSRTSNESHNKIVNKDKGKEIGE